MAENYCDPYEECADLDGRLIINRTIEGPPLARDEGELPLGTLSMRGGAIHPYFHLFYQQHWIAKEACYGPVRSVMGLAPGETVTTEVRQREQTDYVRTVQTALESSEVSTTTRRHGRELIDTDYDGNGIEISPISAIFGSFLEDAWDTVTAPVKGGIDLANDLIDAGQKGIESIFGIGDDDTAPPGTQASGNSKTLDVIDETLSTIQRSESQSSRTDTTRSQTVAVERSITRTFSNPYMDRSIELRFIPVFRHFEVVTSLFRVDFGVLLHAGRVNFPSRGMGSAFGDFLQRRVVDPRIVSVANAELGLEDEVRSGARTSAVAEHLNANSSLYTGRFLRHLEDQRAHGDIAEPMLRLLNEAPRAPAKGRKTAGVSAALEWSKLHVRDQTVYVPLTDHRNLVSALGDKKPVVDFGKKLGNTIRKPDWLSKFVRRRHVHLFMGTHIEAVAGNCVLADIPSPGGPPGPPA
jgi:hypothetical protein